MGWKRRARVAAVATLTSELVDQLHDFFDESYENAISRVRNHLAEYESHVKQALDSAAFWLHPFSSEKLALLREKLNSQTSDNLHSIREKLQTPSIEVHLSDTQPLLSEINSEIADVNRKVDTHNDKLRNKAKALQDVKTKFWSLMRFDYDQVIERFLKDKGEIEIALQEIRDDIEAANALIAASTAEISRAEGDGQHRRGDRKHQPRLARPRY